MFLGPGGLCGGRRRRWWWRGEGGPSYINLRQLMYGLVVCKDKATLFGRTIPSSRTQADWIRKSARCKHVLVPAVIRAD